ncbi:GDSL-type esterase/lipase family protein [Sneathiella marina]|uniref:GDSL-type esterase/lipase family protein n=1 Tax=Sneathiella marina TaxID=2950108 RepID=A0ABY4W646_9PROT|nr:GDSL-type esterase/lipase family protein [Sneathiella marina]USG62637.1 GDSL-type esterase/lipase family protein [Sneathiella marina]
MKRICFVGASTTEGMGDETGQGWPGRLSAPHRDLIVPYNLGVASQLLGEIRQRAAAECAARISDPDEGGIVFCCGMNDLARHQGISRTPIRRVIQTFETLLNDLKPIAPLIAIGPFPVYMPSMPYHSNLTGFDLDFRNEDIEEADTVYKGLCKKNAVPYLSVFPDLMESDLYGQSLKEGDGLHPGGDGYQLLAEKISHWSAWKTFIS